MTRRARRAQPADAPAMAEVLRRSITELCGADHQDRPEILADWLANKTEDQVARWVVDPGLHCIVVAQDGIDGVAVMSTQGRILLLYVDPSVRFTGVSRTLLAELERHARALGLVQVSLRSTRTAERFYRTAGFQPSGVGKLEMIKTLQA